MKQCTKCKEIKELKEFGIDRARKNGFKSKCKSCYRAYDISYNAANRIKISVRKIKHYKENRDIIVSYTVEYNNKNKKRIASQRAAHYQVHKKEKAAYDSIRKKANPGKQCAYVAKRNAAKLQATPKWLTKAHHLEIEGFYIEAARLTRETSIPHEVDHIVPLQGKTVRGLHVPWNLQILTKFENSSKGNKF